MKLLLDQNLSFRLCRLLEPAFPGSAQVRRLGLDNADDLTIWRYAAEHGFTLVSQDTDFREYPMMHGSPPKLVLLRCGNQSIMWIAGLLTRYAPDLLAFDASAERMILEIE